MNEFISNNPILWVLFYIGFAPVHWYVLWMAFRLASFFKHDLLKRSKWFIVPMVPVVLVGFVIDVAFNVLYGCLWFRQGMLYAVERNQYFDKTIWQWIGHSIVRLTLTGRLRYIRYNLSGWRLGLADSVCETWLAPYDKYHCHLNIIK